jgi:hypothetical protein
VPVVQNETSSCITAGMCRYPDMSNPVQQLNCRQNCWEKTYGGNWFKAHKITVNHINQLSKAQADRHADKQASTSQTAAACGPQENFSLWRLNKIMPNANR